MKIRRRSITYYNIFFLLHKFISDQRIANQQLLLMERHVVRPSTSKHFSASSSQPCRHRHTEQSLSFAQEPCSRNQRNLRRFVATEPSKSWDLSDLTLISSSKQERPGPPCWRPLGPADSTIYASTMLRKQQVSSDWTNESLVFVDGGKRSVRFIAFYVLLFLSFFLGLF